MIDAHQHFWRVDRGDYGWLTPALGPIYRDFMPEDLAPLLARHGITGTILVQAAPTVAETRFMLDIARATPFVQGVVGWVDFEAARCARHDRGARRATRCWSACARWCRTSRTTTGCCGPRSRRRSNAMVAHGLVFDALVLPRHLPRLQTLIARHPDLAVVVDHGAKPLIRDGIMEPWATDLAAIAARAACDVQAIGPRHRGGGRLASCRHCALCGTHPAGFGPQRVLFGSDWPVVSSRRRL